MKRTIFLLVSIFLSTAAQAMQCFLTISKDNCWQHYNVTIQAFDASSDKPLVTVIIPEGTPWARQAFECQVAQTLRFQAQFNPVFWEKDEGKLYSGKHFWTLPKEVDAKDKAWDIKLCYAEDFAELPFPPDATTGNCQCDLSSVPAPTLDASADSGGQ